LRIIGFFVVVRNELPRLKHRDRENEIFVFNSSFVHLYIITRVLFIGHKGTSERTNVIKLHSLVGIIGQGRGMNIH
jgi:hypothetical protein